MRQLDNVLITITRNGEPRIVLIVVVVVFGKLQKKEIRRIFCGVALNPITITPDIVDMVQ